MEKHTLNNFRKVWYPQVINRDNWDSWTGKGGKRLAERLNEKVRWILEHHQPEGFMYGESGE
jgi:trimethylamine:corrinoid methyltransferase-like protein